MRTPLFLEHPSAPLLSQTYALLGVRMRWLEDFEVGGAFQWVTVDRWVAYHESMIPWIIQYDPQKCIFEN